MDSAPDAHSDINGRWFRQDQLGAGAKLDHAIAGACLGVVTGLDRADNATRNQACDLTDTNELLIISAKHDEVVLILHVAAIAAGIMVFARDMAVESDYPIARPPIEMDIEHAQANAYDHPRAIQVRMAVMVFDTGDDTIGGADQLLWSPVRGEPTRGISKEREDGQEQDSKRNQDAENDGQWCLRVCVGGERAAGTQHRPAGPARVSGHCR